MANTTDETAESNLSGVNFIWFISLFLLIFFTVFGNCLICLAILKTPTLRTSSNFLIINMALGDILCSLSTLPLAMVFLRYRQQWPLGKFGNIAFDAIWLGCTLLSFMNVTVIALERYTAIVRPFYYEKSVTKQRVLIACSCVWFYIAVLIFALTFSFKAPIDGQYVFLIPGVVYYSVLITHAVLPFILVPYLYIKIFCIARRHKRDISRQYAWTDKRSHLFFQMKATRTIGLVIILFILVWSPFLVKQFIDFKAISSGEWSSDTSLTAYITYCNGPMNIFVYSCRNRQIRKALGQLFSISKYSIVNN